MLDAGCWMLDEPEGKRREEIAILRPGDETLNYESDQVDVRAVPHAILHRMGNVALPPALRFSLRECLALVAVVAVSCAALK
jgi:hypothetical protein